MGRIYYPDWAVILPNPLEPGRVPGPAGGFDGRAGEFGVGVDPAAAGRPGPCGRDQGGDVGIARNSALDRLGQHPFGVLGRELLQVAGGVAVDRDHRGGQHRGPDVAVGNCAVRGVEQEPNLALGVRDGQGGVAGAIADIPGDATAYSHRDALIEFTTGDDWTGPDEDDARITATRAYAAGLTPYTSGTYVNTIADADSTAIHRAYSPAELAGLQALRRTYDPTNVFTRTPLNTPSAPTGAWESA